MLKSFDEMDVSHKLAYKMGRDDEAGRVANPATHEAAYIINELAFGRTRPESLSAHVRRVGITILMWPEPDDEVYNEFFDAITAAAYIATPDGFEVDVSARLLGIAEDTDGSADR